LLLNSRGSLYPKVDGGLGALRVKRVAKNLKRPASFPEGAEAGLSLWTWQCRDESHFILRQLSL
jgi:hypothetical protein